MHEQKRNKEQAYGFKSKLADILKRHAGYAIRRNGKIASSATAKKRWNVIFKAFDDLRSELGYKIQDPENFQLRHMKVLVGYWEKNGLSPSTIQNNISIMRTFAEWIGKRGMVPETIELVSSPEKGRRSYAAQIDRSWSGQEIDFDEQLAKVREMDLRVAMVMELARAFGLRRSEAVQIRPKDRFKPNEDGSAVLSVEEGTKGGRPRLIHVETDYQRDVLRRAMEMAGRGSMIPAGMTKKQFLNRCLYVFTTLGITKKVLGATLHGLRTEYAQEQYRERLGIDAPVKGGGMPTLSRKDSTQAKRMIAEQLGHSRTSIVTAYTGSLYGRQNSAMGFETNVIEEILRNREAVNETQ